MRPRPLLCWPVLAASLFIVVTLVGGHGQRLSATGIALAAGVFVLWSWITGRAVVAREDDQVHRWSAIGLTVFLAHVALASATAGYVYAVAVLAAAVLPLTGLALVVAWTGIGSPRAAAAVPRAEVVTGEGAGSR